MTMPVPSGEGGAGFDPVADPSASRSSVPSGPVDYSPQTRDFAGSGGKFGAVHFVDQKVSIALTVRRGAIASCPEVGSTYHEIKRIDERTIQADVEDRTRLALAELLGSTPPQVSLEGVAVDTSVRSQLRIAVSYRNLLTGQRATASTAMRVA